jgi:hypothetical protein
MFRAEFSLWSVVCVVLMYIHTYAKVGCWEVLSLRASNIPRAQHKHTSQHHHQRERRQGKKPLGDDTSPARYTVYNNIAPVCIPPPACRSIIYNAKLLHHHKYMWGELCVSFAYIFTAMTAVCFLHTTLVEGGVILCLWSRNMCQN